VSKSISSLNLAAAAADHFKLTIVSNEKDELHGSA
jgi:hypothetical protein